MSRPAHRNDRLPIALRLMVLLIATLVAAQILTFAVVVLTPPPERSFYRMEDIATALRGGSLHPREGRELRRTLQANPPRTVDIGPATLMPPSEDPALHLARILAAPPADVVLDLHPSLPRFLRHKLHFGPPPRPLRDGPSPADLMGPGGLHHLAFSHGILLTDFTAALRRADGAWVVVAPLAEPFPNQWQRLLLLWGAGLLLITAPVGYLLARRITAPISAFAAAAEALGRDPSGDHSPLSGPGEIGVAANAFNEMQARLKRYIDDRTAMVGAISHDLRTPLTRMRFKLEAAPEATKAAMLADIAQMEQMITSVLAFIRDAGAGRSRERLDLRSLVECVVDDAAQTGRDVALVEASSATVSADALGLQRLLENLLDNAVKYGRQARVSLRAQTGEALVEIVDQGPGLASGDLERVFQPFYRAELARTLDGGGVGLGLAVARSIARAHGGDVTLASAPSGLTATVRLPLSD